MIGCFLAALLTVLASTALGAAVLAIAGRREWSWIAPAIGLGPLIGLAWLAVRLPGEGAAALAAVLAAALAAAALAAYVGVRPARRDLVEGLPVLVGAGLFVSLPFLAEGHVGVLGTGFNVDMSQHLYSAEWISTQLGPAPSLIQQGYPVGPHSLTVAFAELDDGNLVTAFSGVTVAVPVIASLAAFALLRDLGPRRAAAGAILVGVPYLVASYLAQGAFKELFEATFLLGFVAWLRSLGPGEVQTRLFALPGAALAAGATFAYSGPGLAWIIGLLGIYALLRLAVDGPSDAIAHGRGALAGVAVGLAAFALLVAPEAGRIADFGGSAGNVANASDNEPNTSLPPLAVYAQSDPADGVEVEAEEGLDLFNNDLGNLFGDIPVLEVFGVWPSGDFRVEPGDGEVPAPAFYLGALLAIVAFGVGLRAALRGRELVLLSGLGAATVIYLGALLASTPYTTAKALQMVAPLLMAVSLRGVLAASFSPLPRSGVSPRALVGTGLALAFCGAALISSALALAKAPVGPERYTAGITKLRPQLFDQPTLMLAPPGQIADRHGAEFYGWELRGADPICIEAFPESGSFGQAAPDQIRFVVTVGSKKEPPFEGLNEVQRRRRVTLWESEIYDPATRVEIDVNMPTDCLLGLG